MGKHNGNAMMMKRKMLVETAYAAALALAAISGSMMAGAAQAQSAISPATAKPAVSLSSEAMIERTETDASGAEKTVLKKPSEVIVVPGDRVVFSLKYENNSAQPADGFRATNPMPGPIQFISAAEDWAEVSVDGGKNWGKLASLKVTETVTKAAIVDAATGKETSSAKSEVITRTADARDVTHVRWVFAKPIAAGGKGSVSYRGVVK
jgi:hypothetical protein